MRNKFLGGILWHPHQEKAHQKTGQIQGKVYQKVQERQRLMQGAEEHLLNQEGKM